MMWRAGDRLLTTTDGLFSSAVRWWINAEFSHVVPVLNSQGDILDIRWPHATLKNIDEYLSGKHRVRHLRPRAPLTGEQARAWEITGRKLVCTRYDVLSYLGFVINRADFEDVDKINCAEGCLVMDHSAGLLLGRDVSFISPQSYVEFAAAGLFMEVVL